MTDKLENYYNGGQAYDDEIVSMYRRQTRNSRFVAVIGLVIGVAGMLMVAALLPLKTFEPYIVEVDKTTGYIEVKSGLTQPLTLSDEEAVTQAYIVRFIRARESYSADRVDENVNLAALLSADDAASDLQKLYADTNRDNPVKKYGKNVKITTEIKSVSFPNKTTAIVRFATQTTENLTPPRTDHYVAVLRFRYTTTPIKNEWRFDNPLGFQVTSYQRDQETVVDGLKK